MKTADEIFTSDEELLQLVKGGYIFNFCVAFALNKGFKNTIKEKKEIKFSVGDYEVKFIPEQMCFQLTHKVYFARIIHAYHNEAMFIGESEEEVINDLTVELEKEINR